MNSRPDSGEPRPSMRFGFTPLYLGYADVWQAACHVREVLTCGEYRDPRFKVRSAVT